jgi:hypothetical protein
MSKVLEVSTSGYYKWKRTRKMYELKYKDLDSKIQQVFSMSRGSYGSPRIAEALNFVVSKNTIARRMGS